TLASLRRPTTKPSRATTSRSRSRARTRRSTASGVSPRATPAARTSRAGACTRSASPTRWASTATKPSVSACSTPRPGEPPGSWSTRAGTRNAGPGRSRSTPCSWRGSPRPTPSSRRTGTSRGPRRRSRTRRGGASCSVCGARSRPATAPRSTFARSTTRPSAMARCPSRPSPASFRTGWQLPSDSTRFARNRGYCCEYRFDGLSGAVARFGRPGASAQSRNAPPRRGRGPGSKPAPALRRSRQTELYKRAQQTMPGGTDSNFRAWGDDTVYIDRGQGGRVWDMDGNEYIDLRLGYGPVILGHGDERVDDHVNERMRMGVSFSLTSEDEIRAMELLKELNPWVGKARMTVSGTEATMHAMRVARAYTGRTKIVKFEGQYHGVHDYALISVAPNDVSQLGDEDNPVGLAWGRGIPAEIAKTIIPARYNNIDFLRRLFERQGEEIAAIIVEPVLGNAAGILPEPGFHQAMRALTEEFGILLIFDEVKTGFRFAKGGAAEFFGITPDIATYAKAMGHGYPAAAFAGREDVMSVLPDKVSHGGTYAGNRVAAAAAVKTLEIIRDTDALATIHATGQGIPAGVTRLHQRQG